MTPALVLAGLLAALAVVFVARPFLHEPRARPDRDVLDEPGALERRRLELAEERDRALGALKELEFDHRTGKVSDEDYRRLLGPLRREAAEALAALEPRAAVYEAAATGTPERMSPHMQLPEPVPSPSGPPEPVPSPATPPEPAIVPEPTPVPHERPVQPDIPEPYPVPSPDRPEST